MSELTGRIALRDATRRLAAADIAAPSRDARLLLCGALDLAPHRLTLIEDAALSPEVSARFQKMIEARAGAQPVAQILGTRLFWNRSYRVTGDVLDPRPETETLIAEALSGPAPARILDLGTGSGVILLTLLAEWPEATGLGVDISPAALVVAQTNATTLAVSDRSDFAESDWFDGISGVFDLVVSNPPYIAASRMATLARDVRDWEPHQALTPGPTGLESYRRIAAGLSGHLASEGRALLEIGADQGETVPRLFRDAGFADVSLHNDLDGRPRVVAVRSSVRGAS
jgi:release factor glutamine methyltransferase